MCLFLALFAEFGRTRCLDLPLSACTLTSSVTYTIANDIFNFRFVTIAIDDTSVEGSITIRPGNLPLHTRPRNSGRSVGSWLGVLLQLLAFAA